MPKLWTCFPRWAAILFFLWSTPTPRQPLNVGRIKDSGHEEYFWEINEKLNQKREALIRKTNGISDGGKVLSIKRLLP